MVEVEQAVGGKLVVEVEQAVGGRLVVEVEQAVGGRMEQVARGVMRCWLLGGAPGATLPSPVRFSSRRRCSTASK